MKKVQKQLRILYWVILALSLAMMAVVLVINSGMGPLLPNDDTTQFIFSMVCVLFMLVIVPTGLRLFKFGFVAREVAKDPVPKYQSYAIARLASFNGVMMFSAIGYLLNGAPSFFYIYVILLLAYVLIYPSMDRCQREANYYDVL
jgi:hypothetical protein